MDSVPSIPSLSTYYAEKPPCCIDVHPERREYFVVGGYNLIKNADSTTTLEDQNRVDTTQERDGSLSLFRIVNGQIEHIETIVTESAILDIKFKPVRDSRDAEQLIFDVATSTGSICRYSCVLMPAPNQSHLHFLQAFQVADVTTVVTLLVHHSKYSWRVGFSLSTGEVGLLDDRRANSVQAVDDNFVEIARHDLEAWFCEFVPSAWKTDGLWSGGDDATLRYIQMPSPDVTSAVETWKDRKTHGAGVTAILPLAPSVISTGSYDDHLRILRVPLEGPGRPQLLAEKNLGGGVWRMKTFATAKADTSRTWRLLICGMYAGAFIVTVSQDMSTDSWDIKIDRRFTEHESMCYGAGIIVDSAERTDGPISDGRDQQAFVTCSFYDKRICLWQM